MATQEQQARWLREYKLQQRGGKTDQQGGGWWPDFIAPRPTKIIHGYSKGAGPVRGAKKKKKYQKQKGGVILGGAEDRTEKQIAWIRKKFT